MRVLAALSVLFLAAACQAPPAEMTEAEINQIKAEVMAFAQDHLAAFEALDAARLAGYWLEENVTSVSFAATMEGPDEMASFYANLIGGWTSNESEWLPGSVVDVISPEAALFQGTARQVTTNVDGVVQTMDIHFTHFLNKVDGVWKLQRNHVSGGVVATD